MVHDDDLLVKDYLRIVEKVLPYLQKRKKSDLFIVASSRLFQMKKYAKAAGTARCGYLR